MVTHISRWLAWSLAAFLVGLPVTVAGVVMVALALPFRVRYPDTTRPFSDPRYSANGEWTLVRLPAWARWWDNAMDGMLGDKRGWWDGQCREKRGETCEAFRSMWMWAAIRNPANYFSRYVMGIDLVGTVVEKLAGYDVVSESPGMREWQFLMATDANGRRFYRFFASIAWPFATDHAVMIDIGWKVKLSHNGTPPDAAPSDRHKGDVFTISPWKSLS